MDQLEASLPFTSAVECCTCGCSCALTTSSPGQAWIRPVKRKCDEYEENTQFHVPCLDISHVARVGIENECNALREMVSNQQTIIQELSIELEEERNASSSAANEAMSMILRLQREKAEVQMEARQFKRFSEEKMAHDAEEILALEDMSYKGVQAIQSLTCEVQAYKHRMMSFGLTESEAVGLHGDDSQNQSFGDIGIYPPLRHNLNDLQYIEDHEDVVDDKFPFVEAPRGQDHLKNIEYRINQLERSPDGYELDGDFSALEKAIVLRSPTRSGNPTGCSTKRTSTYGREEEPDYPIDSPGMDINFKKTDCADEELKPSDASDMDDNTSDRVYTIDSIHQGASYNNASESKPHETSEKYVTTPGGSLNEVDVGDHDVKKLYLRLQALEADRESLKETVISMQTDKAQLVFLREIAQQLRKDMSTERRMPVKKQSVVGNSSSMTVTKWLLSLFSWRKKERQSKHIFGISADSLGLLCILDKGPRTRLWRCVTSTQV